MVVMVVMMEMRKGSRKGNVLRGRMRGRMEVVMLGKVWWGKGSVRCGERIV